MNLQLRKELARRNMLGPGGQLQLSSNQILPSPMTPPSPMIGSGPGHWEGPPPALSKGHRIPNLEQMVAILEQKGKVTSAVKNKYSQLIPQTFDMTDEGMGMKFDAQKHVEAARAMQKAISMDTRTSYGVPWRGADEDLNAQPVNTLPVDAFLQTIFIENKVLERAAGRLFWLGLANTFTTKDKEIVWAENPFDATTDPQLKGSKPYQWGDDFPRTKVSDLITRRVSLSTWALAIEFTYEAIRYTNTVLDDINRKVNFVVRKFSGDVNEHHLDVLTNDLDPAQTGVPAAQQIIVENADEPWTSDLRNPLEDIRDLIEAMENEPGFQFSPTVIYVHTKDFRRMLDYFTNVDHPAAKDPTSGETVQSVDGVRIVKVPAFTGLPQGKAVAIAEDEDSPLTIWDDIDPRFTTTGILHTRQYEHPEHLNRTFLFHKTFAGANRNPKAVGMIAGL